MKPSDAEVRDIVARCGGLGSIGGVYDELASLHPELSVEGLREAFLSMLGELMLQRHLRFLGETQIFRGDDVPREGGVLRFELMPNQDISKIILEHKFWEASDEQRRQISERLMFDAEVFGPEEVFIGGLRQLSNQSPQAVVDFIRSKWPSELKPRARMGDEGFNPLWFEKWSFEWVEVNT